MPPTFQNLIVRRPKVEDLPALEQLASEYENNPLPIKFISAAVVENEQGKIVAFGVLRNHPEAILYVDGDKQDIVGALTLLLNQAEDECRGVSAEMIYLYAQDEKFAKILEKHFGFSRSPFIPMFKEL